MLQDSDRIRNIYGRFDRSLKGDGARGADTAGIIAKGHDWIING
jgi:hypothetical protein